MSRAHNARQKARRRQARNASENVADARLKPRQLFAFVPAIVIAAILASIGIQGFDGRGGIDRKQIQQEVTTLLSGIPQQGTILGSSKAPITLLVFADVECPTVKRFVTVYLPSIIGTWVRDGTVKLEYRSLKTDTVAEQTFFEQEAAALAAGRQGKMWNYVLTFVHEQQQRRTDYATYEFFADIASQTAGLSRPQWRRDRGDPLLFKKVALDLRLARAQGLRFTPSFLLHLSSDEHTRSARVDSATKELESSLNVIIDALVSETSGDVPTLEIFGAQERSLGIGAR